jgi:hypothetical protein
MAMNLVTKTPRTNTLRRGIKKYQQSNIHNLFFLRFNSRSTTIRADNLVKESRSSSGENVDGRRALARLPTSSLLRSLILGSFFTSPILFKYGFSILRRVATSRSPILNPDTNPILKAMVKPLIYDQFCAGTNKQEIRLTISQIKKIGFSGVILCSGKEIEIQDLSKPLLPNSKTTGENFDVELDMWKQKNLQTLSMIGDGDFLGIKYCPK